MSTIRSNGDLMEYISSMMNFTFRLKCCVGLGLILTVAAMSIHADESMAFADRLFQEQDYFRAITEYKRERFYTSQESVSWYCSVKIAEAYWLSQKYESALSELFRLSNKKGLSVDQNTWILTSIGLNYYGMRLFPNALSYLNAGLELQNEPQLDLYRGLVLAESDEWHSAIEAFNAAQSVPSETSVHDASKIALDIAVASSEMPKRSPLAAGLMSTLVPGLGQAYSGHLFDAFQAIATVGVFALATYSVYLYEDDHDRPYVYSGILGAVTLTLHTTNIFGAVKTADYYNHKKRDEFVKPLREAVLKLPTLGSKIDATGN